MIKTLAGLAALAALVAACGTSSGKGLFLGVPDSPQTQATSISMMPAVAVAGSPVTFTSSGLFDYEGYSRHWEFGDGTAADCPSPIHVYQNPGQYEVRLVGSDGAVTRIATMAVDVAAPGSGVLPPALEGRRP
jgi:hypothetical protein